MDSQSALRTQAHAMTFPDLLRSPLLRVLRSPNMGTTPSPWEYGVMNDVKYDVQKASLKPEKREESHQFRQVVKYLVSLDSSALVAADALIAATLHYPLQKRAEHYFKVGVAAYYFPVVRPWHDYDNTEAHVLCVCLVAPDFANAFSRRAADW